MQSEHRQVDQQEPRKRVTFSLIKAVRWGSMALVLTALAGCGDDAESRQAEALYERIQNSDCAAFRDLWSLAEQRDNVYASSYFGLVLQEGTANGCLRIEDLALRVYAPALGKVRAADFNAGLLMLKLRNPRSAEALLKRAAGEQEGKGLTAAMVKLAQLYDNGSDGFAKQPALAAQYYQTAANAGDVEALATLGQMTLVGRGVHRDRARGMQMLSNAAQLGSQKARLQLHEIYAAAGVERDAKEQAAKWLGAAVLLDPRLKPKWTAFMATLSPEAQRSVTEELVRFEAHVRPRWSPVNYEQPIKPS